MCLLEVGDLFYQSEELVVLLYWPPQFKKKKINAIIEIRAKMTFWYSHKIKARVVELLRCHQLTPLTAERGHSEEFRSSQ